MSKCQCEWLLSVICVPMCSGRRLSCAAFVWVGTNGVHSRNVRQWQTAPGWPLCSASMWHDSTVSKDLMDILYMLSCLVLLWHRYLSGGKDMIQSASSWFQQSHHCVIFSCKIVWNFLILSILAFLLQLTWQLAWEMLTSLLLLAAVVRWWVSCGSGLRPL